MNRKFPLALLMMSAAPALFHAGVASGGDYPVKPIRVIVPYAPGGGTDTTARILAQKLTGKWGQSVVVDNRPGAAGILGSDIVAKAAPDGYTLLVAAGAHAINPSLYAKLPYDTVKDFACAAFLVTAPNILAEIGRCIKQLGFKGVSIEPSIARDESFAKADDRRLYPIYEECVRLDVPVNISLSAVLQSTVNRPYELSNPVQIYQVARDFPRMDIHVAHAAWPYVMEMIGVCFVCPNVWLSPDQYMIKMVPAAQEYVRAANHYFADRTLFGTSYPSKPLAPMVREYEQWEWAQGVREKVLHENARRLMRIS